MSAPAFQPSPARDPNSVLARVFGFPAFRGLQRDAVMHVTGGGDALVLMPTGGGKSVCYQVPALCREGTAVVISPLIALMDDQVAALRQLGVRAGALHSELDPDEARDTSRALADGTLDLLYVSPERLLSGATLDRLSRIEVALVAIDEAHCVSAWGHEFRPEYRALAGLRQRFPGVPRVALTATADPRTRADILANLDMTDAAVFAASFHRDNLHIAAHAKASETQQLAGFLNRHKGQAGIVYCGSRNKTERTAARLAQDGRVAIPFHAGLSPIEKRAGLTRFRSGEPVVICATIAFGMGIDRPDVRFVAHLDMPDSPESYYQQIGRAGRDGERADTLLLYGGEDIARARHWLAQSQAPEQQRNVMRARLESMISLSETTACRTRALLGCFGEALAGDCGHCDNCRNPVKLFDGTDAARKALSAVYRTGQRFGALHIVSVLRGRETDAIKRYGHDKLPLFGIGADESRGFWRGVIRQLIARGALRTESGEYATLSLEPDTARPILRGEAKVMLREEDLLRDRELEREERDDRRSRRAGAGVGAGGVAERPRAFGDAGENGPFAALRAWRLEQARSQSLPPYVIFADSVLRDIVAVRPTTLDEMSRIKGVGASKLERYGVDVLCILSEQ
jgi:ATP-dependent DNA helicase RecQ